MEGSQSKKQLLDDFHSALNLGKNYDEIFSQLGNKFLKQGITPKDALSISPGYLENIYGQAYRLYNTGKYGEASHLFRLLIMFNSLEPKYMLGFAACLHMLKDYADAIQAYTMTSILDPENPLPHYHSSDCCIQMKEYISAMLCLELAIEYARDKPEFAQMKERAQLSLKSLKDQVTANPLEDRP